MKALVTMTCLLPMLAWTWVAVPQTALAGPRNGGGGGNRARALEGGGGRRGPDQARMMKVIGLADALDLNESEALKLGEILRRFDERRRPIRDQVVEASQVIERAAEGDASALPQVDAATARIFDARAQIAQLEREQFAALSQGLSPEKKARLAVFLARFDKQLKTARQLRRGMGTGPLEPGMNRRGGMRGDDSEP